MRILYVAKHDSGGNDDEGAITHALQELGHDVQRLREEMGHNGRKIKADFCLFHKWCDVAAIEQLDMPKVFWYFDLVDYPSDWTLGARCIARKTWMQNIIPLVDLGFCTDGDWVANDDSGKLVWLTQGADGRIIGADKKPIVSPSKILLTAGKNGGTQRSSFVSQMVNTYKTALTYFPQGVYREHLRSVIANSSLVIAPDSPITDRYWSNRVYVTLGFGACLLHPYASGLCDDYINGKEIEMYADRDILKSKITYILDKPYLAEERAAAGLERTKKEHTYRHRCQTLVETVKQRIKL